MTKKTKSRENKDCPGRAKSDGGSSFQYERKRSGRMGLATF